MRKVVFMVPVVVIITLVVVQMCRHHATETKLSVPILVVDTAQTNQLRQQLNKTIDTLNSMKPLVDLAIDKLQYQDSLINSYQRTLADTIWLTKLRLDLHEAKLEFKRLAAPR